VELRPQDDAAHFNLGYIYAKYIIDREKAIKHFQDYVRLTKDKGEQADWAKNYILTWETWQGKKPAE
jgi:hypothetical protein